jgi:hypothetical protein
MISNSNAHIQRTLCKRTYFTHRLQFTSRLQSNRLFEMNKARFIASMNAITINNLSKIVSYRYPLVLHIYHHRTSKRAQ